MATKRVSPVTATPPWEQKGDRAAPAAPDPGATLGQYKLIERISPEDSSPVFRALNNEIGREEALKLIASDIDEETRNRYHHEINLLGRLDIPGIITVFGCGTDTDQNGRSWTYFSMPLVRGKNLDEHVRTNNCSVPDKLRLLERTAHIICSLHEADILHKDIKPANVMVTENDEVRILDLGIARLTGETEIKGEYLGTPAFSSPEQLQAANLNQATDVFSFAVMSYLILSGRHPYLDDIKAGYHTARENCEKENQFKLDTYIPEIPEDLSELLNQALSVDASLRPSMQQIQEALNKSVAPATTLKVSLIIGDDCRAERAVMDRVIRNFEVYYGKGLEVETIYGYDDDADTAVLMLWNSKVYLDDVFEDDAENLKYAFFKTGRDPLGPEKSNLRETALANDATKAGFTIIEINDLAELERLFFRFLRRTVKSLYPDTRRIPHRSWNEAPYVGLKTFEYRHAPVFFGRSYALSRCLDFLRLQRAGGHNILLIHGSSGCGKSSLVRAGILPVICENNLYKNVSQWDYIIIEFNNKDSSWQDQLRQAIAAKLDSPAKHSESEISESEIQSWLSETSYLNGLQSGQCGMVFVFDQLESFFSQENEAEQRNYFDEFIMELSSRENAIVIGTIRSDFIPSLNSTPCLQEQTRNHGLYQLFPPSEYELNEIIRYPAIAAGLTFEDDPETGSGLDQSLCREAVNSPEGLPLLEFLLSELYSLARADGLVTWDEYNRLGGIAGALTRKAEHALEELSEECRLVLPRIILKLMALTAEKNLIRNWMPLEEAAENQLNRTLIDHFVKKRLFTVSRRNDRSIVSVSHEALIRSWPRITELADFHRDFLAFRSGMNPALKSWEKASRDKRTTHLLTGPMLKEGSRFLKESPEFLTRREKEYLQESLLENTRREDARNKQRLRYANALIIISLLTVIITAVFSFVVYEQRNREEIILREINDLRSEKQTLEKEINDQQKGLQALKNQKKIIDRINSLRIANNKIGQLASKLSRGSAKFMESLKLLNGIDPEMRSWEWGHLYTKALPDYQPLIGHQGEVVAINPHPDGDYTVTASWDDTAIVWHSAEGRPVQKLNDRSGNDIEYAVFSPDGKFVLTASMRGLINIWPFSPGKDTPQPVNSFTASNKPVRCLTFSPDKKFLLTCDDNGSVKCWDWQNKNFTKPLSTVFHSKAIRCTKAVFSPDGSFFATCGWTVTPVTWTLSDKGIIKRKSIYTDSKQHTSAVRDICFIDSSQLVSVSRDKYLIIWDLNKKEILWKNNPHNDDITSVTYLPSSGLLATASQNGSIILKKPFAKSIKRRIKIYYDAVKYLSFVPGDERLLACSNDKSASILDLNPVEKHEVRHFSDFNISSVKSFCISNDPANDFIYAVDSNGDIYSIDPWKKSNKLIYKTGFLVNGNDVLNFSFIDKTASFVIVLNNGIIIECGKDIQKIKELDFVPATASLSTDGTLALLSDDNRLHFYRTNSDNPTATSVLHGQEYTNLSWISPGKLLLIDSNFYVYEYLPSSGKLQELFQPLLKRHIYQMSANVTRLGPSCLFASRDNKVILTSLKELKDVEFDHHPRSDVFAAAVSPDGMRLASLCQRNNTPYLWNALSGDELFSLDPLPSPAKQIDFSSDGKLLICIDRDSTLRVYYSTQSKDAETPTVSTSN